MDATSRALATAGELREFTVSMLADRASIKETTARTILNRHRHLFDRRSGDSGRRGGQPQVWSVKSSASVELLSLVSGAGTKFDEVGDRMRPNAWGSGPPIARLRVPGDNPDLATAEDLEGFASHLAAREFLPHLVRRLLAATPGIVSVRIRSGDASELPGFDGRVEALSGTPFAPEGHSVWEFGTSKDPLAKANHDLRDRTKDSKDVDPATSAFVVVSMRRFAQREAWAARASKRTPWRDIRSLDADDLCAWLEDTPQVHIWASERMGLRPLDVSSLSRWWETWLLQTDPALPPELSLAGRRAARNELREALKTTGHALGVYATSREEAMAFMAAALLVTDPDEGYVAEANPAASAVVVHDRRAWERLIASNKPLVLVPLFDGPNVGMALRGGHQVLMPMGAGDDRSSARIDLPPIDREAARDAFRRAEPRLDLADADKRAAHARRSLVSLRRSLSISPVRQRPSWAKGNEAKDIAPLVLIGSWDTAHPSDQSVVAELGGRDYAKIERSLQFPSDVEDPPFVRAGNRWQLTSPIDAWALLSPALTTEDLNQWRTVAVRVLSEGDPAATLSVDDRLMASLRGVQRDFSTSLRSGLARSAALMASAEGQAPDGATWQLQADALVRDVLGDGSDASRWASVDDVLPLLAEASPQVFLSAARRGVAGKEPPLKALFADTESGFWGSHSPHTGLLWALELLCWPEDYVAEACEVLARLAEIDPGGRLSNRPADSLRRVLLPWYPQTAAPLDLRREIVSELARRHPAVGWRLILGLLPQHFDSSHPSYRPLFRDWRSQGSEVSFRERLAATHQLVDVALARLRTELTHWSEFVPVLANLPPDDFNRCLSEFEKVDVAAVPTEVRQSTWIALSELTSRHRQFPTAQWALPEEWLLKIDASAASWEPEDLPQRHAKLFDWHPDLPGTDKFDHEEYERKLAEERRAIVSVAMAHNGVTGLSALIKDAPVPGIVGASIADVAGDSVVDEILPLLGEDGALGVAARGWVVRMSDSGGSAWVEEMLERAAELLEIPRVRLYLALPSIPEVWQAIDREPARVRDQYWQATGSFGVAVDDVPDLVERLIEHRRPWSAVQLLALHLHRRDEEVPAPLIAKTLRAAAGPDIDEPHSQALLDYELGVLLDRLDAAGASSEELLEFEWLFFPVLQHTRVPRTLYRALSHEPQLFVELVTAAFRAEDDPPTNGAEASANEVARARQAYMVLREWRQPPGLKEEGTIDARGLAEWIAEARARLSDAGRLKIGDECLGQVLSGSPPGADGIWPAEAIRDLLEDLESESLERGLEIGKFNSRGVTSRGVFDGGKQERALATQYEEWARKVMVRWPKTGRLLREMAESYKSWARREDAMSEQWASDV